MFNCCFGCLVEGAVERVVEDVGLGFDGAWEAVGGVVVRVQRGGEGSVAVALNGDVNGVGIGGDGDFRGEVRSEIV